LVAETDGFERISTDQLQGEAEQEEARDPTTEQPGLHAWDDSETHAGNKAMTGQPLSHP
jgi:hypothetical protein